MKHTWYILRVKLMSHMLKKNNYGEGTKKAEEWQYLHLPHINKLTSHPPSSKCPFSPWQTSESVSGGHTRSHSRSRGAAAPAVAGSQRGHGPACWGRPGSTAGASHPLAQTLLWFSSRRGSPRWPGCYWRWSGQWWRHRDTEKVKCMEQLKQRDSKIRQWKRS